MKTQEMLRTQPASAAIGEDVLAECIEAAFECTQACTACADACLAEDAGMDLTACIRVNLDCADVCQATGRVLSRLVRPALAIHRAQVSACMNACRICGEECRRHADAHEHCRICADACRRCEEACAELLSALEDVSATA